MTWPIAFKPILIAAVLALSLGVAALAVLRQPLAPDTRAPLPASFEYDLSAMKQIDPALVHYRPSTQIALEVDEARAVAIGPQDRIYVAADKTIHVFEPSGARFAQIPLEGEPYALAVAADDHAAPGRIYVAMKSHVEVYAPAGKRLAAWDDLGPKSILTSLALSEHDVLVADAGNRIVCRYDLAGKFVGRIGKRDPDRNVPGFIIPSPYFDVAVSPDGLLRVANPGRHRIEGYTLDGHLEVFWGKAGEAIEAFCGCCNPANFALLPDGSFVTAEKGIPRVKVYAPDGALSSVVVGPDVLAPNATAVEETRAEHRLPVVDVAVDRQGRVLVLDPGARKVRAFEKRNPTP